MTSTEDRYDLRLILDVSMAAVIAMVASPTIAAIVLAVAMPAAVVKTYRAIRSFFKGTDNDRTAQKEHEEALKKKILYHHY
jgi:hypothetical protein